jgi:hypothetical protein
MMALQNKHDPYILLLGAEEAKRYTNNYGIKEPYPDYAARKQPINPDKKLDELIKFWRAEIDRVAIDMSKYNERYTN